MLGWDRKREDRKGEEREANESKVKWNAVFISFPSIPFSFPLSSFSDLRWNEKTGIFLPKPGNFIFNWKVLWRKGTTYNKGITVR